MRPTSSFWRSVTLYTRPHCGLCLSASQEIEKSRKVISFDYHTVDITLPQYKKYHDLYAFDVPVIKSRDDMDRERVFMHRITANDLIEAITQSSGENKN